MNMVMLAMGLALAGLGIYLLVTGHSPLSPKREGVLTRHDQQAARTNALIDLSAAAALVLLGLSPESKALAVGILVVGFAAAFAWRLIGRR